MLKALTIRNYALIEKLDIAFKNGFSTITGETGAGKTILLGALGLIIGNRANTSILKDKNKKCIVEGVFNITNYGLEPIFEEYDIDYSEFTIIRREITPQSKSRAFINDTPVQVSLLKLIGERLIDVHSQHQNLILNDKSFQVKIVDAFADHSKLLEEYITFYNNYKKLYKDLKEVQNMSSQSQADFDYNNFLFEELESANLKIGELLPLEEEQKALSNSETILQLLTEVTGTLTMSDDNIVSKLASMKKPIDQLTDYIPKTNAISDRIESAYLELKDIGEELESLIDHVEFNPDKLSEISDRLNTIYALLKKHNVSEVAELIDIKEKVAFKLESISNHDALQSKIEKNIEKAKSKLHSLSKKISANRLKVIPTIEKAIVLQLNELGMANANFKIIQEKTDGFTIHGVDNIDFAFSANKHMGVESIAKIASGGEISRLMLSLKSLISSLINLPTIIFDEIDTGVSGDISNKMGVIMRKMATNMQVMSITHQPQIASMGEEQFKVVKIEGKETTQSTIIKLSDEERIQEIAKMLSGEKITDAALENAKVLLS